MITGPPPTDDKNIEEESAWIFNQLAAGCMSPLVTVDQAKEIYKDEIGNVLTMLHLQKLDVIFLLMFFFNDSQTSYSTRTVVEKTFHSLDVC